MPQPLRFKSIVLLGLFSAVILGAGCKRENEIPVLTVSPSAPAIGVVSGNVQSYQIYGSSDKGSLSRLIITSKRENGFTTTLVDMALSGSSFSQLWEYPIAHDVAPYFNTLHFELYEDDGDHMGLSRGLDVSLGATLLVESSGHQFYSRNSTTHGESAYDLEERVPVLYSVDSIRRDIQDNPANSADIDISRSWISPAGGRLIRFNSFDYANATDQSLRNAFNSGVPLQQVNDLQVNDIILVKLGSQLANVSYYAALRITEIVDDGGTADSDRYTFNMKWAVFVQ